MASLESQSVNGRSETAGTEQVELQTELERLEGDVEASEIPSKELEARLAALRERLATLEANHVTKAALEERLTALEELLALKSQIAALKKKNEEQRALRIVESGSGDASEIGAKSLVVGASLTLRAALYDLEGRFISNVAVAWGVEGLVGAADLSPASGTSETLIFTPTRPGVVRVTATYLGQDTAVVRATASTGDLSVSTNAVPASIGLASGQGQTGTVNQPLGQELKVRVLDGFGAPVQGAAVGFTVTLGGGAIIGSSSALTGADGVAGVTVKPGTAAGTNSFRATLVADATKHVDFVATGTADAPGTLAFQTEPGNAFANAPFGTQPVVVAKDAFGNISPASGSVTLSVLAGCGSLTGTATAAMSNGIAVFSNVGCDTDGAGARVRATLSAISGDSAAFVVQTPPPGACQHNDGLFQTADGGCKDLVSGLVWSARSAAPMSWYDAIWDQSYAGNAGTRNASDSGRTNDYGNSPGGVIDASAVNYCHSLNEGGQADWRMPTRVEVEQVVTHSLGGTPPYLDDIANVYAVTSTTNAVVAHVDIINLTTGGATVATKSDSSHYVYCVRAARSVADRLAIASGPISTGVGVTTAQSIVPLVVQLKDASGAAVFEEGVTIEIDATSLGSLGGTQSATTDATGKASFDAFTLDTAGQATLTIVGSGLASTSYDIKVGAFAHTCAVEDSAFATLEGGCKDLGTGGLELRRADDDVVARRGLGLRRRDVQLGRSDRRRRLGAHQRLRKLARSACRQLDRQLLPPAESRRLLRLAAAHVDRGLSGDSLRCRRLRPLRVLDRPVLPVRHLARRQRVVYSLDERQDGRPDLGPQDKSLCGDVRAPLT